MKPKHKVKELGTISARVFAALLWDHTNWRSRIRKTLIIKINVKAKELHFKREGKSNQTVSFLTLIFHKYWTGFD